MKKKLQKDNGFPTSYGYLCGHGAKYEKDEDNRVSMFEDDSHRCIDIKGFKDGAHFWFQFFYEDYDDVRHLCQKEAERWYDKMAKYFNRKEK